MAEEEQKKIEEPVTEPPSDPPPARSPEKDSIVPPSPTADDSKALVVVEDPPDMTVEEKSNEGSINRDAVLTRVSTEKKISLIKAWEESEKSKAENRTQKMIALNAAWERSKQAKIESELKLIEEKLEKKKAEYIEQMKNKIAIIHKLAEEKRAIIEAKKGEDLLKAEETAAKHRATGTSPVKSGWFRF